MKTSQRQRRSITTSATLFANAALVAAIAMLGSCGAEPLRLLDVEEPDEVRVDEDADEDTGVVSTLPSRALIGPRSVVDVDRPLYSGCVSLRGLPSVLSGAGYIYKIVDADMGLGVATGTGTWLLNRETGGTRNLHPDFAFGVTAERGSGRLFAHTYDDDIISFDSSLTPTLIHRGENNVIGLVESGDRLYFTEEINGRVGSMAKDGTDIVTLGNMDLVHQLAVDDSGIYAGGSIFNGGGSILHVDTLSGASSIFFNAYANPHDGDFESSGFYSPLALYTDDEAVFISDAVLYEGASGIARIEKSTGTWLIVAPIADLFVNEIVGSGEWLYFTTMSVTQQFGQVLRVPRTGGETEVVLECDEPLRISGLVDDGLYISETTDAAVLRRLSLSSLD